jgi:hypothetical protein
MFTCSLDVHPSPHPGDNIDRDGRAYNRVLHMPSHPERKWPPSRDLYSFHPSCHRLESDFPSGIPVARDRIRTQVDSEYGHLEKVGARRIIHTQRVARHVMVDDLLIDSKKPLKFAIHRGDHIGFPVPRLVTSFLQVMGLVLPLIGEILAPGRIEDAGGRIHVK